MLVGTALRRRSAVELLVGLAQVLGRQVCALLARVSKVSPSARARSMASCRRPLLMSGPFDAQLGEGGALFGG